MEVHHLADLFPLMSDEEFQALKADIQKNGLLDKVVTLDGKILDGRHRYRACKELGLSPQMTIYTGNDPIAYVVSKNQYRRHLTSSQRAMIATEIESEYAKLGKQKQKEAAIQTNNPLFQKIEKAPIEAAKQAAKQLNTNHQYVSDAKRLKEESPAIAEKVKQGVINIPEAKELAMLAPEKVETIIQKAANESMPVSKAIKEIEKQDKLARIEAIKQELSVKAELFTSDTIEIIHADCTEWLCSLPSDSVDLIVIDPPYFQVVSNEWDNQWTSLDDYLQWCEAWMIESLRVLKATGSFYIWGGVGEFTSHIIHQKLMLDRLGFHFKDWLTWKKSRGMGHRKGWLYTREECLWYVKDNELFVWNEDAQYGDEPNQFKVGMGGHPVKSEYKRLTNVWTDIPEPLGAKDTLHYTPKPIEAIKRIIAAHTSPNDLVVDFFGGSGTSGVAALELGRRAILVDSDLQSVNESKARLYHAKNNR